jgi:hypothetical protein
VGLGADDAFVYSGIWNEAKKIYVMTSVHDFNAYLVKWTTHTIRNATKAMFVTSLTTCAAFYANITSDVTSIKCFGLFGGTAIIVLYLLMVFYFPVVVIFHEKYLGPCFGHCCTDCNTKRIENGDSRKSVFWKIGEGFSDMIFDKFVVKVVKTPLSYVWLLLFSGFGIAGLIWTFVEPGLEFPDTSNFQFFTASTPLEQYYLTYQERFAHLQQPPSKLKLRVLFGIKQEDNGYHFNPDDYGTLNFLPKIEFTAAQQKWLPEFCNRLSAAPFILPNDTRTRDCSYIADMYKILQGPCNVYNISGCCGQTIPRD